MSLVIDQQHDLHRGEDLAPESVILPSGDQTSCFLDSTYRTSPDYSLLQNEVRRKVSSFGATSDYFLGSKNSDELRFDAATVAEEHTGLPGSFFAELSKTLDATMRDEQFDRDSVYSLSLSRSIIKSIKEAALLKQETRIAPREDAAFDMALAQYFSAPKLDHSILAHEKPDYLHFSDAEAIDLLPEIYREEVYQLIAKSATLLALTEDLVNPDLVLCLQALQDITAEWDSEIYGTDLLDQGEIKPIAAFLEERISEVLILGGSHRLNDAGYSQAVAEFGSARLRNQQSLLIAARDWIETEEKKLVLAWTDIAYQARLTASPETAVSPHGYLPQELEWQPQNLFETVEQQELYDGLVGVPLRHELVSYEMHTDSDWGHKGERGAYIPQAPHSAVLRLASEQQGDRTQDPPKAAREIIQFHQKNLGERFGPQWTFLQKKYSGDFFSQWVGLNIDKSPGFFAANAAPDDNIYDQDYIMVNPDQDAVCDLFDSYTQQLRSTVAQDKLSGYAFLGSQPWLKFEAALTRLFPPEQNFFDITLRAEGVSQNAQAQLNELALFVKSFINGDSTLGGLSQKTYEIYDQLWRTVSVYMSMNTRDSEQLRSVFVDKFKKGLAKIYNVLSKYRRSIEVLSDQILGDDESLKLRYEQALDFLSGLSGGSNAKSIVFDAIEKRRLGIDKVLSTAQITLAIPHNYREALEQWPQYSALVQEVTPLLAGTGLDVSTLTAFWQAAIEAEEFDAKIKSLFSGNPDARAIKLLAANLLAHEKDLDASVLSSLRPDQAEVLMNRFRHSVYYLEHELYLKNAESDSLKPDIDLVVKKDIEEWFLFLPSAWPHRDGQSELFGSIDETFHPAEKNHLEKDEFISCLMGNGKSTKSGREQAALESLNALEDFLCDYDNGFYRYFSLVTIQKDETEYPVSAFRDHDVYTRLLKVLAHIMKAADAKLLQANLSPENKRHIENILFVSKQLALSIQDFLLKQPQDKFWVHEFNDKIVNITPQQILSKDLAVPIASADDLALASAHRYLRKLKTNPMLPFDDSIDEFTLVQGSEKDFGVIAAGPTADELLLYEDYLPLLPNAERTDDFFSDMWRDDVLYSMGKLTEVAQGSSHQQIHKRDDELKRMVRQLPIGDLKLIRDFYNRHGYLKTQDSPLVSWPQNISGIAKSNLQSVALSSAEMLWLPAYIDQQVGDTEFVQRYERQNGASIDLIFAQAERRKQIDRSILSLKRREAEQLLSRLWTRLNGEDALNAREWANNLDLTAVALAEKAVTDYFNNQTSARQARIEYLQFVAPQSPKFPFTKMETLYALAWIASQNRDGPSTDDLASLAARIQRVDPTFDMQLIPDFFSEKTSAERIEFYEHNLESLSNNYKALARDWSNTVFTVRGDSLIRLWQFLDGVVSFPDKYIESGWIDKTRLVHDLDAALAIGVRSKLLNELAEQVIYQALVQLKEQLKITSATPGMLSACLIFEEINKALFDTYNRSDPMERAIHSRYNSHFYEVQKYIPSVSVEMLFSSIAFRNNLWHEGIKLTDVNLQRSVNLVLSGVVGLLNSKSTGIDDEIFIKARWIDPVALKLVKEHFAQMRVDCLKLADDTMLKDLGMTHDELTLRLDNIEALMTERISALAAN